MNRFSQLSFFLSILHRAAANSLISIIFYGDIEFYSATVVNYIYKVAFDLGMIKYVY